MPLERLVSARRGASASHTASTPLLGELAHDCGASHFEVILGAPDGSPNGTENGSQNWLPRNRKRSPKGIPKSALKDGFQRIVFRKVVQRRIASRCIASRRVASHRVALTFDKDHKAFKKQKQGRPEYLLQRTPPPLKSFRCIHSG